jgi:hypothetical protein
VAVFTTTEIGALTTTQAGALTAAQVDALGDAKFAALTSTTGIPGLSTAAIAGHLDDRHLCPDHNAGQRIHPGAAQRDEQRAAQRPGGSLDVAGWFRPPGGGRIECVW